MPVHDPLSIAIIALALFLGGLIKGATGAGAPVVAVPVMAAVFDVRLAVVIMVTPNLLSNIIQLRQFRQDHLPGNFAIRYAVAGGVGAFAGTALLVSLPVGTLMLIIAGVVVAYILLRLTRPSLRLSMHRARQVVLPVGAFAGMLQGAVGISAPVSVTFLNAMRLERPAFIATISVFFVAMSVVQIPALFLFGAMTLPLFLLGIAALGPILLGMPAGDWLARRFSARTFDRVILTMLACLAARLIWVALT